MQKKLLFLFIGLSFTLLFNSCSKDDSEEKKSENTAENILGTWAYVGYILDGEEIIFDAEFFESREIEICYDKYFFYSKGRLEIYYCRDANLISEYTILDESHIELLVSSYGISEKEIATIIELSENKMILKWEGTSRIFRKN